MTATVPTVSFIGAADLMINETDPDFLLQHVGDAMRAADMTYVNLEGPMCDTGEKNAALTGIANAIRSAPRLAAALKRAGVDVVSIANNHTMDYGVAGLEQTLDLLRDTLAGLDAPEGNAEASSGPAPSYVGRRRQSAGRPRHVSLLGQSRHHVPHPWLQ